MSREDDSPFVLVAALLMLAAVIGLSMCTDTQGQEPIPLPTTPQEAP